MTEIKTQLQKGCGKRVFCEHNRDSLKCGTIWSGDLHLCPKCLYTLSGIEQGEKLERERIKNILYELKVRFDVNGMDYVLYEEVINEIDKQEAGDKLK